MIHCMQGLKDLSTLCYAWRAGGELAWEDGDRFYPGAQLLQMCDCHIRARTTAARPLMQRHITIAHALQSLLGICVQAR